MKILRRHGRRKEFQELLVQTTVEDVERIGRHLVLDVANGNALVVDLGSTGRLVKNSPWDHIASHTHIIISFGDDDQIRYIDPKKTGEVFALPRDDLEKAEGIGAFAIDPLDSQNPLTWQHFSILIADREATMKELLMDDSFICGLGDVYADEVLFGAGIRHDHPSNKLSSQDVRRLYRALSETLNDAVRAGGSSLGGDDFVDLSGHPGQFQLALNVFERDGEICSRCRSTIVKERFASRFTYFCPQCQS
jgi:formamidopyrimidine-DNA glycosylase